MARISTEFRKGVFFVRLVGRNGNESEIKSIIELIEEFGINNIVINLTKLNSLSLEMIQRLNEFLKEKSKEKNLFLIYNQNKSRIFEGLSCASRSTSTVFTGPPNLSITSIGVLGEDR